MSNSYRENENGFFVKVTLFKDDVNKAKWKLPFTDETYKQLSRNLGKIPYIDLTGKTYDEHKQFQADELIDKLQKQGIDDAELISKVWEYYDTPDSGKKGYLVDMYDVSKKASYGSILNTCELSAELVKDSDANVAVLDFIIRIEDEAEKQAIREGKSITPSPSIYGTAKTVDGIRLYDPTQYLDFLHVANATIPANGEHAKMKGFCEGEKSSCKKQMANAALPVTDTNINNTVTQDNTRMSSTELQDNTQQTESTAQTNESQTSQSGLTGEEVLKIFEQYNLPKEVITAVDKMNTSLVTLSEKVEKSDNRIKEFEAREEARVLEQRKSLILKHLDVNKHFKGDEEKFKAKAEWANKMFPQQADLETYLNEAFPIQAAPAKETKDQPDKKQAYGGLLFKSEDILNQEEIKTQSENSNTTSQKKQGGWGHLIPLSSS